MIALRRRTIGQLTLFILAILLSCSSSYDNQKDEIQSTDLDFYDKLYNSNIGSIERPLQNRTVLQFSDSSSTTTAPVNYTLSHLSAFLNGLVETDINGIRHVASALMALRDFNNGNDGIVPQIKQCNSNELHLRFTMEFIDTLRQPLAASTELVRILDRKNSPPCEHNSATEGNVVKAYPSGIIGAVHSAVTSPLSTIGGVNDLVTVSHASTSDDFSSKLEFPLLARTIPSAGVDAEAVVSYFREVLNATHLGVLYVNDPFGTSYARVIQTQAESGNYSIVVRSVALQTDASQDEAILSLKMLNQTGYRYFVAILFEKDFQTIMPLAYDMGIAGENYFWMFTENQLELMNSPITTGTKLAQAVHGSAILAKSTGRRLLEGTKFYDSYLSQFSTLWKSEDGWKYLQSKLPHLDLSMETLERSEPNSFEFFLYEAVVALCIASCDAARKTNSDFYTAQDLYESFVKTTFGGVYGPVFFNQKTGDRQADTIKYAVYNILSAENTSIVEAKYQQIFKQRKKQCLDNKYSTSRKMVWESRVDEESFHGLSALNCLYSTSGGKVWELLPNSEFIYADGTTTLPDNLPPLVNNNASSTKVAAVSISTCGLSIGLSILWIVWTYTKRKTKVVRAAQPLFLYLLCCGTIILGSSIIPLCLTSFDLSQGILDGACASYQWLYCLGFTVSFSSLFSKTRRIYHVSIGTRKSGWDEKEA
uniref:G-protein coupled receptors family 3 profile domain-containing protein n=1 Tax=Ditylum brightwellii TaxID=49249 RepID=A0A6V2IWS9_9STRA